MRCANCSSADTLDDYCREHNVDTFETADTEYILLKAILLEALEGGYVPGDEAVLDRLKAVLKGSAQTPQIMHSEKPMIEGLIADIVAFGLHFGPEMVESFQHKAKKLNAELKKLHLKLEKHESQAEVRTVAEEAEVSELELEVVALDLANGLVEVEGEDISDLGAEDAAAAVAAALAELQNAAAAAAAVEEAELTRAVEGQERLSTHRREGRRISQRALNRGVVRRPAVAER